MIKSMPESQGYIFLVIHDTSISDFIGSQALEPLGYRVKVIPDVSQAILEVARTTPDLVLVDLDLPGLKAKDLLAAFGAQGVNIPVIVLARRGEEAKLVETFRLGARDFLFWPVREAEVAMAVERVLKQVKEQRTRQQLEVQLQQATQDLQRRSRELAALLAIGKLLVSISNPRELFDKVLESVLTLVEADLGWFLLREGGKDAFALVASRNLPEAWMKRLEKFEDGLTPLVALSGEILAIHGEPLQRFKVSALGKSAIVVPLKVKGEVVGLFVLVRRGDRPFDQNAQAFLETVAHVTVLSVVNAHLFRALEEAAEAARQCESTRREQLAAFKEAIATTLRPSIYPLELLLTGKMGKLAGEQVKALETVQQAVKSALEKAGK